MRLFRTFSFALAVALTLTNGAPAQDGGAPDPSSALAQEVQSFVRDKALAGAALSVHVVDVGSGQVLASYEAKKPLNPASNMKIYTATAALALLHGEHRFATTVSGRLAGGTVKGALVVRGSGDPTFSTEDVYGLVHELRAHGVKRVEGDILVDAHVFDDQFTPPAFEQQPNEWAYFRAPVSAVPLDRNVVKMTVRAQDSGPAVVTFDPPGFVDVEGEVASRASGGDGVTLELSPVGPRLHAKVGGSASGLVRYPRRVEDPTLLVGFALRAALLEVGVKVTGDVKAGALEKLPLLASHESAPLAQILPALGKQSDNFTAETVFKSLDEKRPAQFARAGETLTAFVRERGLLDEGMVFRNGSGLFDANRVTTRSMAELLRWAYREPAISSELVAQLAIGGIDGTLGPKSQRFREYRKSRAIRAKTGTLERVVGLSGYVLAPDGRSPVAFSIIGNGGAPHAIRSHADAIVGAIHASLWKK